MPAARAPIRPLTREEWHALFAQVNLEVEKNPQHPLLVGKPEGNPIQTRAPWAPSPDAWGAGISALGGTRWEHGIQNPRRDFKSAALASNDAWKNGVTAAVQGDRFAKGMGVVNVDAAIATALKIGAQGYTSGALARKDKFAAKVGAIQASMGAVVQRIRGMPNATLDQRIARVTEVIRGFHAAGKKGAGATTR